MENLSEKEIFDIANDISFWDACMDTVDGAKPLQRNPLQMVGDRMRLIESLEKHGFRVIRKPKK